MKIFLVIILVLKEILRISCQHELSMILSVIKYFEIRQLFCIDDNASSLDLFAGKKEIIEQIPATYISFEQLMLYSPKGFNNDGIGIIIAEYHLGQLSIITQRLKAENLIYRMARYTWLVISPSSQLETYIGKLLIPYNCQFFLIQKLTTFRYQLIEYYTITDKWFTNNLGVWDYHYGLETKNIPLYWRRLNLNGTAINIMYREQHWKFCKNFPFSHDCETANLLEDFSRMMNFERKIIQLPVDLFLRCNDGYMLDICNYPQILNYFSPDGSKYYNIGPLFKASINWYIKRPRSTLQSDYFIRPFQKHLWKAIILYILAGTMFVIVFSKLKAEKKASVADRTFLIFESFCNQTSNDKLENAYMKIISIASKMIALIITASFGAVIASFVAVEIVQAPFTNIEEFFQNGQYKLILTKRDSFQWRYFYEKYVSIYKYKTYYDDYVRFSGTQNPEIINDYQMMCNNERLVALGNDDTFEKLTDFSKSLSNFDHCHVYRIPKSIDSYPVVLIISPFSPFVNVFKHSLIRFYEAGITMKMQQNIRNRSFITKKTEETFHPVELKQMTLVLSIPFCGILISLIIVIIECVNKNRNKPKDSDLARQ